MELNGTIPLLTVAHTCPSAITIWKAFPPPSFCFSFFWNMWHYLDLPPGSAVLSWKLIHKERKDIQAEFMTFWDFQLIVYFSSFFSFFIYFDAEMHSVPLCTPKPNSYVHSFVHSSFEGDVCLFLCGQILCFCWCGLLSGCVSYLNKKGGISPGTKPIKNIPHITLIFVPLNKTKTDYMIISITNIKM